MNKPKYIQQILLALFLTFSANQCFAECTAWNISVFPRSKTISTNSIFIVEGYGTSQSVIRNLNKRNAIYLTSGNDTIQLSVFKTLKGQFHLTQAILKPKSKLHPRKHYKLNIDGLDEYEKADFERDSVSWTVSDITDNQKPIWNKLPTYNSKGMIFFGCGPDVSVNFCACISDDSPVVVYAKVKNINTNSSSDYYITPDSLFFTLGHGMCSGEFDFEEGQEYEASFSLMDASGNTSSVTKPIKFISPTEKDEIQYGDNKATCDCTSQMTTEHRNYNLIWILMALVAIGLIVILALKRK